jgi:hypothetical protein
MQCEILERFLEYIIAGLARREAEGNRDRTGHNNSGSGTSPRNDSGGGTGPGN